jgi:hypothetical protein
MELFMRHYFFTLLLVCLPMSVTYADVASIKQAFKNGKTVKEVIKDAVDNGENITAILNDVAAADATKAYQAIRAALLLYPQQKEIILTAGETLGLTRALMLSPPTTPTTSNNNQTTNTSSPTSNTGSGGSQTNNKFTPVNIITIPFPTNTGEYSVGGGGCTGGTVLSKNPTTGVSRCASRS